MELHLKDYFTLANAASGFLALVLYSSFGYFASFGLIVLAVLFDFLDGIVARKDGSHNEFGKQLDSLADAVSFGAAPVALVFFQGAPSGVSFFIVLLGCVFFLSSVVLRLAKFNLQTHKGVYFGLPSPAAALILLLFGWISTPFTIGLLFALGVLMTVPIQFKKVF